MSKNGKKKNVSVSTNAHLQDVNAQLRKTNDQLQATNAHLQEANARLQAEKDSLTRDLDTANCSLRFYTNQNSELWQKNTALQFQIRDLNAENASLKASLREKDRRLNTAIRTFAATEAHFSTATQTLRRQTATAIQATESQANASVRRIKSQANARVRAARRDTDNAVRKSCTAFLSCLLVIIAILLTVIVNSTDTSVTPTRLTTASPAVIPTATMEDIVRLDDFTTPAPVDIVVIDRVPLLTPTPTPEPAAPDFYDIGYTETGALSANPDYVNTLP